MNPAAETKTGEPPCYSSVCPVGGWVGNALGEGVMRPLQQAIPPDPHTSTIWRQMVCRRDPRWQCLAIPSSAPLVTVCAALGPVLDGRNELAPSAPHAHLGLQLAHNRGRCRPIRRRHLGGTYPAGSSVRMSASPRTPAARAVTVQASRPADLPPWPRPAGACHMSRTRSVRSGNAGPCRGGSHPGCGLSLA